MQGDQSESYRAVADGQEAVSHGALPLLPHLPQPAEDKPGFSHSLVLKGKTCLRMLEINICSFKDQKPQKLDQKVQKYRSFLHVRMKPKLSLS